MYEPISRIYDLNLAPSETSLTLAVRTIYVPFGPAAYTNFFTNRALRLGGPGELSRELELWSAHGLFERLPRLITALLLVALALFLLTLYFTQKGHREYLWLALYEAIQAPTAFVELAGSSARLDQLWYAGLTLQLIVISAYLYFEFLIAFLSLRRRWSIRIFRYTAPVLAFVGPSFLLVGHYPGRTTGFAIAMIWLFCLLWMIGWLIFIFFTLIVATFRRNFEAGLLLIPLVLSVVGDAELSLTGGMVDFGGGSYHSPLTLQAGPIPIHFASIADITGIIAIMLIIFVRFLRVQRDQERASNELAAARSVQELMIPQEKLATPGYEVESVYNPANEVGGDFYHLQSTSDGGLLVVIGDVAGKGLQAAMNVSMLMGALRSSPERSPAKILESLNRVLVGGDSYTTCQAAWFGPRGEVVLANAGHLPPYLNSQEVALPGGLPLGVLAAVSYPEIRLYLHPGDRILLMSDGVVEARQPSGELFGFDRVHNLSNQSAFYIADASKEFGQEDDITVLTIRRLTETIAA
jgi:HAMP domain-containing protein